MEKTFKIVQTDDGSESFYSYLYNEGGHSTSGADAETQLHYIQGCKVSERIYQIQDFTIFEVGFGIGIGFKQTFHAIADHKFTFYSIEIDEKLIEHVIAHDPFFRGMKKMGSHYELQKEHARLIIVVGDARQTVPKFHFHRKFHAIYQDAFSPKRNASLWTTQWFALLKKLADDDVILSTYSSSSSIRKSLIAAGWKVKKGEKFGPKRSSTRAMLSGETDKDILEHLQRSPAQELTDDNAKQYTIGNTHDQK
jgi:tRNA U34 5-methylaminomethyl-2-thiouridine-forming methyltransferase MnmC